MCVLYVMEIEGSASVGGWRSGVLCQHPSGSPRLLLLLLPLAWVRSMSCDRQLDQSPLCSKTSHWRMCSHACSIAKRNVLWCSGRDTGVSAKCEKFCLNLLSFCYVFVNVSHHFLGVQPQLRPQCFANPLHDVKINLQVFGFVL